MGGDRNQSILLIDNDIVNLTTVQAVLKDLDVDVVVAEHAERILDLVLEQNFALILLAVDSSDPEPFERVRILGKSEQVGHIPVIFQAEAEEIGGLLEQGYAAGAVDFLERPVNPLVLKAKVKVFLELAARQQQLEIATSKVHEQNLKLEQRAIRDSLTGLYNHNHLQEQLAREVSRARRYKTSLSVFLLDLDFFKDVNDSCGHPFGDFVLKEFTRRVLEDLRKSDIFGRYGGEEFLVILPNIDAKRAEAVAEKLREKVASTVFANRRYTRYVTVSIGVYSGFGDEIAPPGVLIDYVDNALYQAKAEGRNRVVHYRAPEGSLHGLENHIKDAIDSSQQSQLNATIEKARAMTIASFEAMVHAQTREYDMLVDRNNLFNKVLDQLTKKLNLPEKLIHSFRRAIKLHDLFRCYIHDSSLETEGPLNTEQENMLFDQPLMLRELTTMFDFFASERVILYSHHEHYDGSGYPDGLKGNEIPMASRIFTLIDSFVAMSSPISEKRGMSREEVAEELRLHSGGQFDPFLVDMLLKVLEENNFLSTFEESVDASTDGH
ncbi:MAG: diguanylate cyclase [Proteobacteria bacterium]|nr:diguanylate cyclase [Pseudomonadota bacterium]MBU1059767.1 diguanylate cyclase [Pseudomonadota bacterium]